MYLCNKKSLLIDLVFRGVILSKKRTKTNKKQTLIFLRSPKHFNVGKRKVISFNNRVAYKYAIGLFIYTKNLKNTYFFFNLLSSILNYDSLFRVNSIKVTTKTTISWDN